MYIYIYTVYLHILVLWSNVNPGFITPWAVKLRGYWDIILTTYHYCLGPRPHSSARVYCSKVDIMIHYDTFSCYTFIQSYKQQSLCQGKNSWRWTKTSLAGFMVNHGDVISFFCWTRSFKAKVERICRTCTVAGKTYQAVIHCGICWSPFFDFPKLTQTGTRGLNGACYCGLTNRVPLAMLAESC